MVLDHFREATNGDILATATFWRQATNANVVCPETVGDSQATDLATGDKSYVGDSLYVLLQVGLIPPATTSTYSFSKEVGNGPK